MDKHLVQMANDIASAHQTYSEGDAVQMISEHINKFWAPSMRQKLFEAFQRDPAALSNLIAKSLLQINCEKYNPNRTEIRNKEGSGG